MKTVELAVTLETNLKLNPGNSAGPQGLWYQ